VQVLHDEDVAKRIDPESCAAACVGISEALTGERTGERLSYGGLPCGIGLYRACAMRSVIVTGVYLLS
jgi:hypothetical protein